MGRFRDVHIHVHDAETAHDPKNGQFTGGGGSGEAVGGSGIGETVKYHEEQAKFHRAKHSRNPKIKHHKANAEHHEAEARRIKEESGI